MGWLHQHRDQAREFPRRVLPGDARCHGPRPGHGRGTDGARLGIAHILRRRARWVGARLRRPSPR